MATSSTFSYAQAAKGQATQSAPSTQTTPSTAATNAAASVGSANGHVETKDASDVKRNAKNEAAQTSSATQSRALEENTVRPTEPTADIAPPQQAHSTPLAALDIRDSSIVPQPSISRDDERSVSDRSNVRDTGSTVRSLSSSTRVTDDSESKKAPQKGRQSKKTTDTSGETETVVEAAKNTNTAGEKEKPKVELTEAPLPAVNIWTVRREAAKAAKAQSATAQALPVRQRAAGGDAASVNTGDQRVAPRDAKKKPKMGDSEPATASNQNHSVNGFKAARKAAEDDRGDGEAAPRRGASRGSRLAQRAGALPSVVDAASWPTPETAVKEDKRKTSMDKVEKPEHSEAHDDVNAPKARKREHWERMDFVPTVNWETHVPALRGTRGGRGGGRGGRETSSRGGGANQPTSVPAEKGHDTVAKTGNEHHEKARDPASASRASSVPPTASKQLGGETARPKEQRKPFAPARSDRPRESSSTTQGPQEHVPYRGEGRGERGGRGGGYRGARGGGGHPAANSGMHSQQAFLANGASNTGSNTGSNNGPNNGPAGKQQVPARHQHYTSPPIPQTNSFSQGYGPGQGRPAGRGSRQMSASSGYSHRANGHNGNATRPRPLSTQNVAPYSWDVYSGMPLTAPPYSQPSPFNLELKSVLTQQVEYYFSVNNLCKDGHLRRHMDSQGFVFLSVIHGFSRVYQLSTGDYFLLRLAVAESTQLDFVVGKDNIERIRSRNHWQNFVLPMDQRAEAAQSDGPDYFVTQSHDLLAMNGATNGYTVASPTMYGNGTSFEGSGYANGVPATDGNGQLSADVPEFQPGGMYGGYYNTNGHNDMPAQSMESGAATGAPYGSPGSQDITENQSAAEGSPAHEGVAPVQPHQTLQS